MSHPQKKRTNWKPGPACAIIGKFGGTRRAAKALERKPSTVQSWKESGHIPAREQAHVLEIAKRDGIDISPTDFFEVGTASEASQLSTTGAAAE